MLHRTLRAAAASLAPGAMASGAQEPGLAGPTPPAHTITAAEIEPFSAAAAASNTDLTVRGCFGGEPGAGPTEQNARVVQCVADVPWGLPGSNWAQIPLTMIAELPGVVERPVWGKAHEGLARALDDHLRTDFVATRTLAQWSSDPSVLIMKDKHIRPLADLQGPGDAQKAAVDSATGLALSKSGEDVWNAKAAIALERLRANPSRRVIDLTPEEAAVFDTPTLTLTDQAIADLDARGPAALAVRAAMVGN